MHDEQHGLRRVAMACGVVLLLLAARPSDAGLQLRDGWGPMASVAAGPSPGAGWLDRHVHRLMTRAENTTSRLRDLLGTAGLVWASLLGSACVFLLVAAVSSVVDFRMFALRREGPGALARYLGHGTLTFVRILGDRRTPTSARLVLVGALVYWLIPHDLIPDDNMVPGFIDDVLIAVSAAKGFMYLCPDSLVARHAAAVEAHA
jgi:hypothetical protein